MAQVLPCSGIRRSISCLFWSSSSAKLCCLFRAVLRNLILRSFILGVFIRKKESEVTQSCLTLCNPMDFSLLGSSIHGMFQARVLEWVAISFSRSHLQSIGNHPMAMNYLHSLRCKIHIFLPRSCNSHPIVASGINTIQFSSIQSFSYVLCPTL